MAHDAFCSVQRRDSNSTKMPYRDERKTTRFVDFACGRVAFFLSSFIGLLTSMCEVCEADGLPGNTLTIRHFGGPELALESPRLEAWKEEYLRSVWALARPRNLEISKSPRKTHIAQVGPEQLLGNLVRP